MKTTTYQQALKEKEISLEIPVYPSQQLLVSQKGIFHLESNSAVSVAGGGGRVKF